MERLLQIASDFPSIKTFFIFLASASLAKTGNLLEDNSVLIGGISIGLQWLAWGGASAVAGVTVIKFLQENGFLPKGKR